MKSTSTRGSKASAQAPETAAAEAPKDQAVTVSDVRSADVMDSTETREVLARVEAQLPIDQITFSQRVGELIGQRKFAQAVSKVSDVTQTAELARIRESREYKGLRLVTSEGECVTVTQWAEFCVHVVGRSKEQVDADIANLAAFGEEAMTALKRIGAGYRDLRALKKLPEDDRDALLLAAKSGDIDDIKSAIEEVAARTEAEKHRLAEKLKEAQDDIATKEERAGRREKENERLSTELRKARLQASKATPDETSVKLREATNLTVLQLRSTIFATGDDTDSLRERFNALRSHALDFGIDQDAFMAGIISELLMDLRGLRDDMGLPILNDGAHQEQLRRDAGL